MVAEIITVGTELLLGQILNTNARRLALACAEAGIDCYRQVVVGDNLARAAEAIAAALGRADVVLISGGLGPTQDDLTREAIARATGLELELDPDSLEHIRQFFTQRGRPMAESNRRQAMLPRGARAIPNPHGTAPGVLLELGPKVVVAMPGPPGELEPMLDDQVLPYLAARAGVPAGGGTGGPAVLRSRVLKLVGIGESDAESRVADLLGQSNPTVAPLVSAGEVHFRITAKAPTAADAARLIAEAEARLRERLGPHVFGADEESLAGAVIAAFQARGWTLAVAESCTGGLVADELTNVPGSSAVFERGLVTYSNASKIELCGVAPELLQAYGAVSEPVAGAMAEGVRERAGTTVGLGVTGIAGPGGGSEAKPVGLVYIGLAGPWTPAEGGAPGGTVVRRHQFAGRRRENKRRFAQQALAHLWRLAQDAPGPG